MHFGILLSVLLSSLPLWADAELQNEYPLRYRELVDFVAYEVPRIPADFGFGDTLDPDLVAELDRPTIRNNLGNVLDEATNCLQLTKVWEQLVLEFHPESCPHEGWLADPKAIAFYVTVDDIPSDVGTHLVNLRRLGKVVGALAVEIPEEGSIHYSLDDMFCVESEEGEIHACDVTVRYKQWYDLRVNLDHEFSDAEKNKRYGYDAMGTRHECRPLLSDWITTEGSGLADACEQNGFNYLLCAGDETKYLCEGDLGEIKFALGSDAESQIQELAEEAIGANNVEKVETHLYDGFLDDPEMRITVWISSGVDEDSEVLVSKLSEAFAGVTLRGEDGRFYDLSEFVVSIGIGFSEDFDDDF